MAGVRTLRKIQLGAETTAGTATTATALWRGNGVIDDQRVRVLPEEDIGLMIPVSRAYDAGYLAVLTMDDTEATYEQLCYVLSAGVEDITTGTRDGTEGSGYVYQYDLTTNAQITPQSYTIEMGDDQRVDEMEYSVVTEFSLSGAKNEAWMLSATWNGRQVSDAEFTTSISVPSVGTILFQQTSLYIDTSGGTLGNTPKTSTFLGFSLDWTTGIQPIFAGDGNLYFSTIKQVMPGVTGTLILEHDATGAAEITAARTATTQRLIRLLNEGATLTTSGTTYSQKTARLDMAIEYTAVPPLTEDEGDDTIELPFRVTWVSAKSLGAQIVLVNELSALT